MKYVVILTGVGPTRAAVQRVSHAAYLATWNGGMVQVRPFPDMASRLSAGGVHHSVMTHGEDTFSVSIHLPNLPRWYSASVPGGVVCPLDVDDDEEAARSAFVAWCCEHATRA